jgi:hypothetical protein
MKNVNTKTEPEINDSIIEEAVSFIQEKISENSYKTAVIIGNYILEKFFNDDIEYVKSHNPNKSVSFRKLCQHPDIPINHTKLFYMLKVAHQDRFLTENNIEVEKLTFTNMLNLTKIPDNDTKLVIIKKIINENLSCKATLLLIKQYNTTNTPIILRDFDENNYKPWLYKPIESIEKLQILLGKQILERIPFSKTKLANITPNKSREILEIVNETINNIDSIRRCYLEMKKYLEKKDIEKE